MGESEWTRKGYRRWWICCICAEWKQFSQWDSPSRWRRKTTWRWKWYQLPQVVMNAVLLFLGDADMYGYLKFTFQPNENVYIDAVVNISIQKHAVRKVCSIDRWKTWKNMLIYRPWLRANGFYTLQQPSLARLIGMMPSGKRNNLNQLK